MHLTQEPSPFFQDGIYTLKSEFLQPNRPSFSALIANSGAENKLKRSENYLDLGYTSCWQMIK